MDGCTGELASAEDDADTERSTKEEMGMKGNASRDYSRDLQERLEVYLIGLVFTLLAAAVQTAKFSGGPLADACELTSWLCLFTSGLAGMWRLEWLPVAHLAHGAQQDAEESIEQLDEQAARGVRMANFDGREVTIDAALVALRERVSFREREKADITASTRRRYSVHKWAFVSGLALMLFARGYVPAKAAIVSLATTAPPNAAPAPRSTTTSAPAASLAASR
jgi:hypothetical protein